MIGTFTPHERGSANNKNGRLLHIPQIFRTSVLLSDEVTFFLFSFRQSDSDQNN